ncbi:MAG: cadmium-translocating P-type ATPase [Lachnospiraceae bacterium]|nr:cadmium-translocating P-type ATPase [Lachnospiraceae bacterium]
MTAKQKKLLIRVIAAGISLLILYLLPIKDRPLLRFLLFLIPYLTVGYDILRKAFKGIINRQVFDECFLMAIATLGAMALGEYSEGVAVMWFYQIGELFQSYAVGKSRKNISQLMDIRPDYANIEEEGKLVRVDPDDVEVGSIILIEPGEKVPIDGVIEKGRSSLDVSALTGESLPVDVSEGMEVMSGSINLSGLLRVRTSKEFEESTASKILDLVENAGSRKSRSEKFISKFARVYTPFVCFGALVVALLFPLFRLLILKADPMWGEYIYRALTFLVISCPCAIVVSIPLSFFGGIGGAGNQGILIKGSNYMEILAGVKTVVFDKTGTITRGNFEVSGVHHSPIEEERLIEYAALAELHSSHPISLSLRRAYGKEPDKNRISDVKELPGKGLIAVVDKKEIAVGNIGLMHSMNIQCEECHSIGTIVYVAIDKEYMGHIVISDEMKPHAREAVRELKKAGVTNLVMLTGDLQRVADEISKDLGIDRVYGGLLPEDKVTRLEDIISEKVGKVAFVGDGINDAPVLSRADIGFAMGALGSDAAIEAADVVLMDDDPMKISKAIKIGKKCIRIVYENIGFAIGVKAVCLVLGALGIANMWLAIFADVGVMILCVLNAIRCLFVKKL